MHRAKRGLELLLQPRRLMGRFTGPKVLVTSVPKAGTNMLMHALSLFPQLTIQGTVVGLPLEEQLDRISKLRPGRVFSAHLPVEPALNTILDQNNIKVVFINRDPRDVCVSLFHYIMREPKHRHHSYYHTLSDDHSRLVTTIIGHDEILPGGKRLYIPSIDVHFRNLLGWLTHPRCCAVTFEEFVGPKGGGDSARQRVTIQRIAKHLGVRLTSKDVDHIANNVFSTNTATFRRGQIGSWRQAMTPAHRAVFKEVAGQLLIDLGCETDFDW